MARRCPNCECLVDASGFCSQCGTYTMGKDERGYNSAQFEERYENYNFSIEPRKTSFFRRLFSKEKK